MNNKFDVIVIGAGHAGIEAAFACSNLNLKTALITLNEKSIAMAPCNPSIGGPAKGIVTREIDALGGQQGIASDLNCLQIKLLNSSKGPGVWALRSQIDKVKYHEYFLNKVKKQKNLSLIIDEANDILIHDNYIVGVSCNKQNYESSCLILTTGTYLNSLIYKGSDIKKSGPDGLEFSHNLSCSLKKLGFSLIRLKTGTPPRIKKDSIDYSQFKIEPGTDANLKFSHWKDTLPMKYEEQLPCWILHTVEKTHEIIRNNLNKSAMYGGYIKDSIGPRYCPSIEDKIVKFPDKSSYQLFVEPESKSLDTIYLDGFSTSMPIDIQDEMIRSLPGFENCEIIKYAYAIEYDAIDPLQLYPSLMSKKINGLFFAGQINGTSGYEEAAGQGLIAGINAYKFINNQEPLILKRHESYIGVMIDDLVTKGITEPYRLLTSRAEYRLNLRNDNACDRLSKYGFEIGLLSKDKYFDYLESTKLKNEIIDFLKNNYVGKYQELAKITKKTNLSLYEFLKRPDVNIKNLLEITKFNINKDIFNLDSILERVSIEVKFDGYIKRQDEQLSQLSKLDKIDLTFIKDYKMIPNISLEAIEKLNKIKPFNLDQATRISGINLTDIAKIKYYVENLK